MTDVPPDNGAPGPQPEQPSEQPVVRRSNFTPPPPDAEPPTFDDDLLADAMAAEVRPYTSPIKLPWMPPPVGAEVPGLPPVASPVAPMPAPQAEMPASPMPAPQMPAPPMPAPQIPGPSTPATPPLTAANEELFRALGTTSTLEAIERLESELRRVLNGEPPSIILPEAVAPAPAEPAPVGPPADDAPIPAPAAPAPAAPAPAAPAWAPPSDELVSAAAPERVPLPGTDALGWNQPSPSVEPATPAAVVEPAAPAPAVGPAPAAESPFAPVPSSFPGTPPVTDIADVAESASQPPATAVADVDPDPEAVPVPEPVPDPVTATPAGDDAPQAFAWMFPPSVSEPVSEPVPEAAVPPAEAVEPSTPEPTPEPPVPTWAPAAVAPPFPGLPPVDESLIDPAAAAALESTVPPTWDAPSDDGAWNLTPPAPPAPPVPPASPTSAAPPAVAPVVVSNDAGPQFATPVPFSTEPPTGPESPDWLDAPPPDYTPPELVEPPAFVDAPNPALDPVAPITANTMARLPMPLPTAQPNIEDRAELPPPPGYEDIPILSADAEVQSALAAPLFFPPAVPPAVPPPVPPAGASAAAPEPLLPVAASAVVAPTVAPPLPSDSLHAPPPPSDSLHSPTPDTVESSSLDDDDGDVIDILDRVAGGSALPIAAPPAAEPAAEPAAPPSAPVATIRLADDEPALVDEKPQNPAAFDIEPAGLEPTPLDLRAGHAARLFWLWFAANASIVSMGLGAVLLGTGMSLRQTIVATLAGVAISFLPLGLGTLAGKWSGQPTMVVSRATFGLAGNILPALLALVTRVLWGGVLLWVLATAVAQVLVGAGLDAGLGTAVWQLAGLVIGFVLVTLVAVFGYGLVAHVQRVLSIVSALLIVGAAALTFSHIHVATALTVPDGSWLLAVSGAALVFSVVGLAWVHSSSDLARYQRPGSSGGASMLWATFGATLPPFLLIAWGALLAASDPRLATQLRANPLAAIASLLPSWYPAPLLIAAALGLLSGAVLTIYSGGFAVQALGLRVRRGVGTLVTALLVLAIAAVLLFVVVDFSTIVRDLITTVAVPVAAWAGIFAAEMMIRTRRFHTPSLLSPGGVYPQVRWLNFLGLIVVSAIGFGFVSSQVSGLGWEGFLFRALGVAAADPLSRSALGVFVALLLGLLLPIVGGIPAIRRQEHATPPEAQPAALAL